MPRHTASKDIFIIHSKSHPEEAQVATHLSQFMADSGYSVYEYDDWDWELIDRLIGYSWDEGDSIDLEQLASGEPPLKSDRTRIEIDRKTLDGLLGTTRLVLFIHPTGIRPTRGVLEEIRSLRRIFSSRRGINSSSRVLVCRWEDQETLNYVDGVAATFSFPRFQGKLGDIPLALGAAVEVAVRASLLLLQQAEETLGGGESESQSSFKNRWSSGLSGELDKAIAVLERARAITHSADIRDESDATQERFTTVQEEIALLADAIAKHRPYEPQSSLPPGLHPLIKEFHQAVERQVERASRRDHSARPFEPDVVEWRRFWVRVFEELCEPLYRFVCLPGTELGSVRRYHMFISDYESSVTLNSFERLCFKTELNHILDFDLATYVISDCLATLAQLVNWIAGRSSEQSFAIHRVTSVNHILTHLLFREGYWKGDTPNRQDIITALREVPFPFRRYCGLESRNS